MFPNSSVLTKTGPAVRRGWEGDATLITHTVPARGVAPFSGNSLAFTKERERGGSVRASLTLKMPRSHAPSLLHEKLFV